MEQNRQSYKGKAIAITGLLSLFVFLALYEVSNFQNKSFAIAQKELTTNGRKTFSELKDYHEIQRKSRKVFLYTYKITDEKGEFHEVTEEVDEKTRVRLRVGDTVLCYQTMISIFGMPRIVTKIEGNQAENSNFEYVIIFSKFGAIFSFILFGVGIILIFRNKLIKGEGI